MADIWTEFKLKFHRKKCTCLFDDKSVLFWLVAWCQEDLDQWPQCVNQNSTQQSVPWLAYSFIDLYTIFSKILITFVSFNK